MKKYNMIMDSPGKSLFIFALPIIIGNLFQQFYSMVDSIIVGQYVGEEALAAVGASYSLTTVFIMIAIGGGLGASVLTSQYLGAKEYGNMKTSVYTSLITFLCVSIAFSIFGFFMNPIILKTLNTPDNILSDAILYLQIYFLGLPFLFMYNILSATFNALGKSKIPLFLLIFSSILNIFLDLLLVITFDMGVAGVAIATVIAQGTSAVISFIILMKKLKLYHIEEDERILYFSPEMLKKMIAVAIPSMLQQSIVSIGMLLVQSVVNGFGSSVVAGYAAASRIESVCIVPMIATGNAVSTFTAQNLGAGKPERVKKGYQAARIIVAGFASVICIVLMLFHNQLIAAFIDADIGAKAFAVGNSYALFLGFFYIIIGLKACTDGVLRGAGDIKIYMSANIVNLVIRVVGANVLAPILGVAAVWYVVPIGWAANFVISFIYYMSGKWMRIRLIKD